jgi:hypothetical protein
MTAVAQPAPICDYCRNSAEFLPTSERIYSGRNFGPVWACFNCNAWVGVHPDTQRPLGRLADARLRRAKRHAHAVFDPLWMKAHTAYTDAVHSRRVVIKIARSRAYLWLGDQLGLTPDQCHIGLFDVAQCERVIDTVCRQGATPATIRAWAHARHQNDEGSRS